LPGYYRRIKEGRRRSGGVTVALGAAMLAVGEILEPTKTSVEVELAAEEPGGDHLDLRFGGLPPPG
jgi:hypothetical protein